MHHVNLYKNLKLTSLWLFCSWSVEHIVPKVIPPTDMDSDRWEKKHSQFTLYINLVHTLFCLYMPGRTLNTIPHSPMLLPAVTRTAATVIQMLSKCKFDRKERWILWIIKKKINYVILNVKNIIAYPIVIVTWCYNVDTEQTGNRPDFLYKHKGPSGNKSGRGFNVSSSLFIFAIIIKNYLKSSLIQPSRIVNVHQVPCIRRHKSEINETENKAT